jgi:hypothetical protein
MFLDCHVAALPAMTADAIAGNNGISIMTADAIAGNNGIPVFANGVKQSGNMLHFLDSPFPNCNFARQKR